MYFFFWVINVDSERVKESWTFNIQKSIRGRREERGDREQKIFVKGG
jgi:hypothetical protein